MGTVNFKKNGKVISIPWWYCANKDKIRGLYKRKSGYMAPIAFNEEITEIIFDGCKIDSPINFKLSEHQKLIFKNCDFSWCDLDSHFFELSGGNLDVYNSNFDNTDFRIVNCNSVFLNFNREDTRLRRLCISASDVSVCGEFKANHGSIKIVSNYLDIHDVNVLVDDITFDSLNLNIKNSNFEFFNSCSSYYKKLTMADVIFFSDCGELSFNNIVSKNNNSVIHDSIATYHAPINLSDSDILDEKQQAIYSLLSVLKGYKEEVNRINQYDIDNVTSEINNDCNLRIDEVDKQLELLASKRRRLIEQYKIKVDCANKSLSNRKVKTLTYPKK